MHYSLLGRLRISVTLDKECGEYVMEQCSKVLLVENYTIKKKIATVKQTVLKDYFSKVYFIRYLFNIFLL